MTDREEKIKKGLESIDQETAEMVLIESPYAGNIELNTDYLEEAILDCFSRGEVPFASHGFFTYFLDDNKELERDLGISAGFLIGNFASKVVVYEDMGISKGMRSGIQKAEDRGQPVEHRTLEDWNHAKELTLAHNSGKKEQWPFIHPIALEVLDKYDGKTYFSDCDAYRIEERSLTSIPASQANALDLFAVRDEELNSDVVIDGRGSGYELVGAQFDDKGFEVRFSDPIGEDFYSGHGYYFDVSDPEVICWSEFREPTDEDKKALISSTFSLDSFFDTSLTFGRDLGHWDDHPSIGRMVVKEEKQ